MARQKVMALALLVLCAGHRVLAEDPGAAAAPATPEAVTAQQASGSLSVTPAVGRPGALSNYTVTWSGVQGVLDSDRIGVFYGDKIDPSKHPIKYMYVSLAAPDTYKSGSGSVVITLPVLRAPVTVAYVRLNDKNYYTPGIWAYLVTVASAVAKAPAEAQAPHNIKLSVATNGVATRFGSTTKQTYSVQAIWQTAATVSGSQVQWGTSPGSYPQHAGAARSTYAGSNMCDNPAKAQGFSTPGSIYHAVMKGLAPNTKYYYRVGSKASWSAEASFTTPPEFRDAAAETRIILTADMGFYQPDNSENPDGNTWWVESYRPTKYATPGTQEYVLGKMCLNTLGSAWGGQQPATQEVFKLVQGLVSKRPYHAMFVNGDISYARGEAHQWDMWSTEMEPFLRQMVGAYSSGNHEADGPKYPESPYDKSGMAGSVDSGGECNKPYRELLRMPQPSGANFDWFSFDMGPVHFVQLNSEQHIQPKSKQVVWLENDLKALDRTQFPWVVVSMHRPVYADVADSSTYNTGTAYAEALEPLFAKYQVDAVWVGHVHSYSRSCPMFKGTCVGNAPNGVAKGPVHIMTGNAGFQAPLDLLKIRPAWIVADTPNYGVTEVVATRTSMVFKSYSIADPSNPIDTFTLTKPAHWKPSLTEGVSVFQSTPAAARPAMVDVYAIFKPLAVYTFTSNYGLNASRPVQKAFMDTYLVPTSRAWQLATTRPGAFYPGTQERVVWTPKQVWEHTYPFMKMWVEDGAAIDALAKGTNGQVIKDALLYIWDLVKEGGRCYYGP